MKNLLITLVALVIGVSCMPASAAELSISGLWSAYNSDGGLAEYFIQLLIQKIALHPMVFLFLSGLSMAMPVIGFIANRTANPIDNAILILLNKILQTLSFNSSKNQPDVLSWYQLLTNKPSAWPSLLVVKISDDTVSVRARVFQGN